MVRFCFFKQPRFWNPSLRKHRVVFEPGSVSKILPIRRKSLGLRKHQAYTYIYYYQMVGSVKPFWISRWLINQGAMFPAIRSILPAENRHPRIWWGRNMACFISFSSLPCESSHSLWQSHPNYENNGTLRRKCLTTTSHIAARVQQLKVSFVCSVLMAWPHNKRCPLTKAMVAVSI